MPVIRAPGDPKSKAPARVSGDKAEQVPADIDAAATDAEPGPSAKKAPAPKKP